MLLYHITSVINDNSTSVCVCLLCCNIKVSVVRISTAVDVCVCVWIVGGTTKCQNLTVQNDAHLQKPFDLFSVQGI